MHRKDNKSAVKVMRHNQEQNDDATIQMNCENEISCLVATSKYILIGLSAPDPKLHIYSL